VVRPRLHVKHFIPTVGRELKHCFQGGQRDRGTVGIEWREEREGLIIIGPALQPTKGSGAAS